MQRIKMEHHLNHQMMVTTAPSVIDRESPVITIASHHSSDHSNHSSPGHDSTKDSNSTISAIVLANNNINSHHEVESANRSQSVNSNASLSSNESGGKLASSAESGGGGRDSEQTRSSQMAVSEESGNKSPHTHVITEAPSSRAEQLKSHIAATSSPILNNLVQHPTPSMSPANTTMVLPVQGSPESMTNSNSNSSNANTITIQELSHAQIVIGGNEQMAAWQHPANAVRGQVRPYGHRMQNSLSIDQDRDNDSPHPSTGLEPSSPTPFYVQQLHHRLVSHLPRRNTCPTSP